MEVENRFIDYFDPDTEIYKGMYEIDSKLGGTATLDIIISQPEDSFESIEIEDEFFDDDFQSVTDLDDSPVASSKVSVKELPSIKSI